MQAGKVWGRAHGILFTEPAKGQVRGLRELGRDTGRAGGMRRHSDCVRSTVGSSHPGTGDHSSSVTVAANPEWESGGGCAPGKLTDVPTAGDSREKFFNLTQ